MTDHTWGSWVSYTCPACGKEGFKGMGGLVAHITKTNDETHAKERHKRYLRFMGWTEEQYQAYWRERNAVSEQSRA